MVETIYEELKTEKEIIWFSLVITNPPYLGSLGNEGKIINEFKSVQEPYSSSNQKKLFDIKKEQKKDEENYKNKSSILELFLENVDFKTFGEIFPDEDVSVVICRNKDEEHIEYLEEFIDLKLSSIEEFKSKIDLRNSIKAAERIKKEVNKALIPESNKNKLETLIQFPDNIIKNKLEYLKNEQLENIFTITYMLYRQDDKWNYYIYLPVTFSNKDYIGFALALEKIPGNIKNSYR